MYPDDPQQDVSWVTAILAAPPRARLTEARLFPTGWGEFNAETKVLSGVRKDGPATLARLPHLSRFQLFGDPSRASQLEAFVGYLARHIETLSASETK
jgi:hypothetical protein